jgi:hypothetical protein
LGTPDDDPQAQGRQDINGYKIGAAVWLCGGALIGAAALTSTHPARAVPAFAQQTGHACKSCHVGGFGPELTPHGREFKLSGYTMREMLDQASMPDHGSMQGSMQDHSATASQSSTERQMSMPGPSSTQGHKSTETQTLMHDRMSMPGSPSKQCQSSTPDQSSMQGESSSKSQIPMPGQSSPKGQAAPQSQSSTQCPSSIEGNPPKTERASMGTPIPIAAMAITSFTHIARDQVPPPEHLGRNNNLVLDEAAIFLAGGFGDHFGVFAEATYDGVERHFAWDNLDVRAVTNGQFFGEDATFGLSFNNSPTVQDAWNTLPAWGFPFTDTAVSPTPAAAPLIDGALAQNVLGMTAYGWIGHKFYLEGGGYSSPSSGFLRALGADPKDPGSIHGLAPYGRVAYQTQLAGGTFEIGASALKAAIFPGRDRSSRLTDHYTDLGLDSSWQKALGSNDLISANLRYEHEQGNLRASCALGLIGDGSDPGCARYHLNEWRGAVRYTLHDKLGLTLSPFSITGSRNSNLFENGSPNSNGLMGQVDYTFWPDSKSPLGPLFNIRVGAQYTAYRKFDGRTSNASDNNALRLFVWVAY